MRISLVHWAFPPTTGGVESHLADLASGLGAGGHDVTVFTGEPEPSRATSYEVVSTPLLALERVRERDDPAELTAYFDRELGGRGIELVHGHNLHHFAAGPALALEAARGSRRLAIHHTFHETWPDLLRSTPVYRGWDGNYAVSEFVREGCARRIGFRPELLRLGVDVNRFRCSHPPFADGAPATILHPARLLPWKGVHTTVDALALLRDQGHVLRLLLTDTQRIADWESELDAYRERIRRQIRDLGLTSSVELVAPSHAEMPAVYERADLVVYPTVADEPYGLVPLEAMSCGRPVVASRCGGITETVVDGETGYLVEPQDPAALAKAIDRLLSDPAAARELGLRGRARVVQGFSFESYLAELEQRYAGSAIFTRSAGSARRSTARAR